MLAAYEPENQPVPPKDKQNEEQMINPIRRAPLGDRSNIPLRSDRPDKVDRGDKAERVDKADRMERRHQGHPVQQGKTVGGGKQTMEEWWEWDVERTTGTVQMREMETALRETMAENKKVHELCGRLLRENEELKAKLRELAVVSMLYDAAKDELEELREELQQRDKSGSDQGSDRPPVALPTNK